MGNECFAMRSLFFDEDTSTLEASISEDRESLYKLMEANKMKPCQITVNLREFKGQRFLDVTGVSADGNTGDSPTQIGTR